MDKEELYLALNSWRLSKPKIDHLVQTLEHHPDLVEVLLDTIYQEDKEGTFNASWVFDHLMRKRLAFLLPQLDKFCSGLATLQSESCIRPMAHVCQMITEAYFKKKDSSFRKKVTEIHLDQMVTACFDWLIGEHKMAAKVFAMTSLLHLGKKFEWIHPELRSVLEQSMGDGTAGYRNRAEKTLNALVRLDR